PLPPLAAVGYVLIEQKCSLFGLEYKKDPTVILLYQIAKEALDHQIQDHNSTVERLIDVATETKKQFKRILEVSDEGNVGIKKMKSLASAGVLYAETCLHKYQWPVLDDSDMMPLPLDLPPNVQPPKRSTHIGILPQMPSEPQLDDMKYAREFKEEYLKTHKQMNWKVCYDKGLAEGYFSRYKNYKILKSTFNELKYLV
ncbi:hypothetical protein BDC45DRAFT_434513, partial [Circinella umbellata]